MKKEIDFRCPKCQGLLVETKNSFLCNKCRIDWNLREGIPSFLESDFYWSDEISKTEAVKLLKIAKEKGWRIALHDVLRSSHRNDYRIISDLRRADFRFLMPLNKESIVLDIGCGWGAITVALSKVCRAVVGLDATFEYVKSLEIRRQQEKMLNIFPVHGGVTLRFPLPEDYFDAAIMVGVLEWAGVVHRSLKPRQAQKNLLLNVFKVLKPGGHLYIGIENRYGYNYLMGRPDHNGVRFVSLMPRKLADIASRIVTGAAYRTYQYSLGGYAKLLQEVGFCEIEFYAPLPEYHEPHYFLPLENANVTKYFLNNLLDSFELGSPKMREKYRVQYQIGKLGAKMALALGFTSFVKYVVPSYGILAKK